MILNKFKKEENNIRKKLMSKDDWKRIKKKEYIFNEIKLPDIEIFKNSIDKKSIISIIKFIDITEPFKREFYNKDIILVDIGYYWLQIAIENENFWITAIFDSNKELLQIYIDITKENVLKNNGKSYCLDLFLDIVIMNNDIFVLDEDELENARKEKNITESEYLLVLDIKYKLLNYLNNKENINILKKYLINELNKYY